MPLEKIMKFFYDYYFRWEYIWCVSVVITFVGLSAARSNKIINMQKFMIGLLVFGLFPVFYCIGYYMSDVLEYIHLEDNVDVEDTDIKIWQVVVRINQPLL
jgi:uncharacterized membrane protein